MPVSLTDPERVIVPPLQGRKCLSLLILHIFYQSSNLLILVKSLDFQQPASITVNINEQSKCQLQTISEFMHTRSNSNCTCIHISRKSYLMHVLKQVNIKIMQIHRKCSSAVIMHELYKIYMSKRFPPIERKFQNKKVTERIYKKNRDQYYLQLLNITL